MAECHSHIAWDVLFLKNDTNNDGMAAGGMKNGWGEREREKVEEKRE